MHANASRTQGKRAHMMSEAMTALLSLPRVSSQRLSRSRMTVTRNLFSCSSTMLPEMLPMAQQSVLRAPQLHSLPLSCTHPATAQHLSCQGPLSLTTGTCKPMQELASSLECKSRKTPQLALVGNAIVPSSLLMGKCKDGSDAFATGKLCLPLQVAFCAMAESRNDTPVTAASPASDFLCLRGLGD